MNQEGNKLFFPLILSTFHSFFFLIKFDSQICFIVYSHFIDFNIFFLPRAVWLSTEKKFCFSILSFWRMKIRHFDGNRFVSSELWNNWVLARTLLTIRQSIFRQQLMIVLKNVLKKCKLLVPSFRMEFYLFYKKKEHFGAYCKTKFVFSFLM